jgi:hypothetical protein
MHFSLVGIQGKDMYDGNQTLTLGMFIKDFTVSFQNFSAYLAVDACLHFDGLGSVHSIR